MWHQRECKIRLEKKVCNWFLWIARLDISIPYCTESALSLAPDGPWWQNVLCCNAAPSDTSKTPSISRHLFRKHIMTHKARDVYFLRIRILISNPGAELRSQSISKAAAMTFTQTLSRISIELLPLPLDPHPISQDSTGTSFPEIDQMLMTWSRVQVAVEMWTNYQKEEQL